jgi:RHH-type proline utilization regulon transcriptional repressor/proline dehydrogenase/delta 1-pyrroline-5-carboxylate dehydrogenase
MLMWPGRKHAGGVGIAERPGATRPAVADIGERTTHIGRELLQVARRHRGGLFSARFWAEGLVKRAMHDPAMKVALLRFIDVFPVLRTAEQVYEYLVEYLGQPGLDLPAEIALGLKAGGLAKGLLAKTVAGRIAAMAGRFIAGRDPAGALPVLERLWKQGLAASVDLLGEACLSDEEAWAYQRHYQELLQTLAVAAAGWPPRPALETDHLGRVPRASISIKITALAARVDAIDPQGSLRTLEEALLPILKAAAQGHVSVYFDMEQAAVKGLTIDLFQRCCEAVDFPAGLALQAYLRGADEDAERLIAWASRAGRQVTVRLIKGAYWDYEVVHAERMGWPVPVWTEKSATDASFERLAGRFVAGMPRRPGQGGCKLALGSHNARSIAWTLALLEKHGLPPSAVEFQKLYGMAEPLAAALQQRGLRVREYVPVGEMIPGMAYLVRRLLENTSNESWLRAGFGEDAPDDVLLAPPGVTGPPLPPGEGQGVRGSAASVGSSPSPRPSPGGRGGVVVNSPSPSLGPRGGLEAAARRHALSPAVEGLGDGLPMLNEPARDFSDPSRREHFAWAVASTPLPPAMADCGVAACDQAVAEAAAALEVWGDRAAVERSRILVRAAALLREDRDALAALMIREAGKPWREADADVCEAIDFCEFYARSAVGLFQPKRLGRFAAELNHQWHQPRGVAAVISPWNFPLAITTGMTVAALATGNTAVLKPSSQTRAVARRLCEILWQAGVSPAVLHFLPGSGRQAGERLVRDPRVAIIAFTGSKEVGLGILRLAAETPAEQRLVKKVVCEMGGKNAIIVDESADLDEAVLGVRQSAFGYCGQKCSACSRAIAVDAIHDAFLKRLVESTRSLVIGDPADPASDLGPVIDEAAAAKIRGYIEIGSQEGRLELACQVPPGLAERVGKPFVGPHIFAAIEPRHRLANEEIFGPVLSVMRASDFDQALCWANAGEYKLTGGVFSRRPSHLEAARRKFRVGNLYLNRGITGALVGRQPFGGFGLSGTGTQAGGGEYLLHFIEPRTVAENTIRHGFTPTLDG